jgi:hypothetical protein
MTTPVVPVHTYMRERDTRCIYAREREQIQTCTHNSRRHPLAHEGGRERERAKSAREEGEPTEQLREESS